MRHQKIVVKVKPEVLRWTIESAGWELNELAEKTEIEPELLNEWKTRESSIDLKKLEKIADSLKRPLAVFFLPEPPKESILTDYRKIAGFETKSLSKKTLTALRNARYIQSNSQDLLKLQEIDNKPKIQPATLNDEPDEIANRERQNLGLEFESENTRGRVVKKPINQLYASLRAKIESLNIFVIQANMPLNEARGFTLTDKYPRIIVINSADELKPRIFTLLHEYAHILLKKDGICLPNSENFRTKSKDEILKIEKWCNAFSGTLLMPKQEFLSELSLYEETYENTLQIIIDLSKKFRVSKKAVIVRILNLSKNQTYKEKYLEYYDKVIYDSMLKSKAKKGGGGVSQVDKCLSQKGKKFVKLVSESRNKRLITSNEMISYLNLKTKHFDKLQAKI